jgi:pentatricopeptide repeat protein
MYGKCASVAEAENVFNGLVRHDTVSCTAMLSSYVDEGEYEKAMLLYSWMEREAATGGGMAVDLDDVMLVYVLLACRGAGTVEVCRRVHFAAVCAGLEASAAAGGGGSRRLLGSTLVHANAGLASLPDARAILDGLAVPETAAWNACMAGYASVGSSCEALALLCQMRSSRASPDLSTLGSLLSACNRDGSVDLGTRCFALLTQQSVSQGGGSRDPCDNSSRDPCDNSSRDPCDNSSRHHFVLLVDLLGRAGDFRRARDAMQRPPARDAASAACLCLVSAARMHADSGSASFAFARALDAQCADAAAYVLMSNLCADPLPSF